MQTRELQPGGTVAEADGAMSSHVVPARVLLPGGWRQRMLLSRAAVRKALMRSRPGGAAGVVGGDGEEAEAERGAASEELVSVALLVTMLEAAMRCGMTATKAFKPALEATVVADAAIGVVAVRGTC